MGGPQHIPEDGVGGVAGFNFLALLQIQTTLLSPFLLLLVPNPFWGQLGT